MIEFLELACILVDQPRNEEARANGHEPPLSLEHELQSKLDLTP